MPIHIVVPYSHFPFFPASSLFAPQTRACAEKEAPLANEEHVQILKQGVKAWNLWRIENPAIQPDLSAVILEGAKLVKADLSSTTLNEANLAGADLYQANLIGANLGKANLIGADLIGADLIGANLIGANLSEANLSAACAGETTFADVDLSKVKGMETVIHFGPSTIGIDTVHRSKGNIPDIFLRGAGVGDDFISLIKAHADSIQFYSCFISYSSKDQEFAERLYADLQAKGVRCWYAPEDLKIGDPFRQRIDDAIRLHDKLLVVLSETSVGSSWVESEVESALERERKAKDQVVLFPIRLDEAVMETKQAWAADIRRQRHMGDFRNWRDHHAYQKAFQRLLRDLKGTVENVPA